MQPAFNQESTTADVIAGISLAGKTAVITGTSSGLGFESAKTLANAGATVIMAARDTQKNAQAIAAIRAECPAANLENIALDLSDLNSVRTAADKILSAHSRIDILINNAGVMACPFTHTAQNIEMQLGSNHIGHFLLTCLLVPALKAAQNARVINLSSGAHRISPLDFDDPQFTRRPYNNWVAYGQSKTANMLFSVALARRLQHFGITVNAVHPGTIHTGIGRHLTPADYEIVKDVPLFVKTPAQGAATQVWAATHPSLASVTGKYLEDCRIGVRDDTQGVLTGYAGYALDPVAAEKLWALSETLVGQSFDFK